MAVGMQIAPGCWSGMILIYYHTHKKENRFVRMLHKSDSNLFCTHVFLAKGKNVSTHILVNEERCPVALLTFGQGLDVRHLTLDYFGKQKSSWSA